MKQDQYKEAIPDDLVLLPDASQYTDYYVQRILDARWYEVQGVLLVSSSEIDYLSEGDPADAGIDVSNVEIMRVDDVLHRFSMQDGFYHA